MKKANMSAANKGIFDCAPPQRINEADGFNDVSIVRRSEVAIAPNIEYR